MRSLNRFVIALIAGLWLASGPWAGFAGASDDGTRPERPRRSETSLQSSDTRLLALQIPKLEPTPGSEAAKTDPEVKKTGGEPPAAAISDAEQISQLQKSIEQSKKELAGLQQEIEDPEGEYPKAEADFRQVDEKLTKLQKALKDATGEDAQKIQDEIATTQKSWQLAKDRFDLAIEERKTLKEQAAAIEQKVQQDQKVLDKLTGVAPAVVPNATAPGNPNASAMPNATVPEAMPNATVMPNASAAPNSSAAAAMPRRRPMPRRRRIARRLRIARRRPMPRRPRIARRLRMRSAAPNATAVPGVPGVGSSGH